MKYGVMNTVLRKSWEESFAEAKRLGFDGVELTGVGGKDSKLEREESIKEINQLAAGLGIEVPSVTLSCPYTFADPDSEKRKVAIDVTLKTIRACKELGAWVILVGFFGAQELAPKQATSDIFMLCALDSSKHQLDEALTSTTHKQLS